jgi:CheY-like chemotaxis protein
MKSGVA